MKNVVIFCLALTAFVIASCAGNSGSTEEIGSEEYNRYLERGDSIAVLAQAVLLGNVSNAMQTDGPEYAVEFCNLEASEITDSLNNVYNCVISRVSAKNRNPENNLKNEQDSKLWQYMAVMAESGNAHDTLIQTDDALVYYKPIKTALPACLNCHGVPGEDIQPATLEKIQALYPADRATGYALNEFRGLWKIHFAE